MDRYKVGDTIVHWTHGLGTVVGIDDIYLDGKTQRYYVVEVAQFKLWVPVEEANEGSLRFPVDAAQFKVVLDILRSPGEQLPSNPYQRKIELRNRMQKRTLEGLCRVICDLTDLSSYHNLNQNDASVLFRAEESLLDEWVVSLGVDRPDALHELERLLREDRPILEFASQ